MDSPISDTVFDPHISANKLAASQMMAKASCCFICGQQFEISELSEHEKSCLQSIQSNDVQFTKQSSVEDHASTLSSIPDSQNLSNHSGSSNDSYEKKFNKCYICGTDVPTYLQSIHEKSCRKNWETGLLDIKKSNVRSDMFFSLSRGSSRTDVSAEVANADAKHSRPKSSSGSCGNLSADQTASLRPSRSISNLSNSSNSSSKSPVDKAPPPRKRSSSLSNQRIRSNSLSTAKLKGLGGSKGALSSLSKAHSLQDLSKLDPSSDEKKKGGSNPQYVVCHLCGKLYSQHSIGIHVKKCEITYELRKEAGVTPDYKVKSNSSADLRKAGKENTHLKSPLARTASAGPSKRPSSMILSRDVAVASDRLTIPTERLGYFRSKSTSSSTGNLSPSDTKGKNNSKAKAENKKSAVEKTPTNQNTKTPILRTSSAGRQNRPTSMLVGNRLQTAANRLELSKLNFSSTGDLTPLRKRAEIPVVKTSNAEENKTPAEKSSTSPGLQKCNMCGQMYGTRSLPIHQKQCAIKCEREKEEEGKKKKEKKREIKLLPFGRSKFPENQASPSPPQRRPSSKMKPSKVFGVVTPEKTRSADELFQDFELFNDDKNKENNIDGKLVTCEVCASEYLSVDEKKHKLFCRVTTL